jgi:hypothetical protein
MIALGLLALLFLLGVGALVPLGLRAGDRPGDAFILDAAPRTAPRGARVTVTNPGDVPVVVGMSLRRPGTRLGLEGGSYVRIRTGSTDAELRADAQAQVGVLDAAEARTFMVPAGARVPRRAELVVIIGQAQRLRTIHRLVVLPQAAARPVLSAGGGHANPWPARS